MFLYTWDHGRIVYLISLLSKWLEELTWEWNNDKTSHIYDNNKDMYIK